MIWLPKEQWIPAVPPLLSVPGARSVEMTDRVIAQFGLATHPRYQPVGGATYCKTFVEDFCAGMSIPFPHWVDSIEAGNPAPMGHGNVELDINAGVDWLLTHGVQRFGWRVIDELAARAVAATGEAAIAAWKNPSGHHGHTGVVRVARPSEDPAVTWFAQAGTRCFEHDKLTAGFGTAIKPLFLAHP